jgi:hypothetical protein
MRLHLSVPAYLKACVIKIRAGKHHFIRLFPWRSYCRASSPALARTLTAMDAPGTFSDVVLTANAIFAWPSRHNNCIIRRTHPGTHAAHGTIRHRIYRFTMLTQCQTPMLWYVLHCGYLWMWPLDVDTCRNSLSIDRSLDECYSAHRTCLMLPSIPSYTLLPDTCPGLQSGAPVVRPRRSR